MATKTRVVLDLNTRVKVIHASERDKLSVKQIMKMCNISKILVYEILKKKMEILTILQAVKHTLMFPQEESQLTHYT